MSMRIRKTLSSEQIGTLMPLPRSFAGKPLLVTVEVEEPHRPDQRKREEAIRYFSEHPLKSNITLEEVRAERAAKYEALS